MATRNRYAEIMAQYQQAQPFSFFGYPQTYTGGFTGYPSNYTGGFTPYTPKTAAPVNRYEEIMAQPARAGGGRVAPEQPSAWSLMTPEQRAAYYAENPTEGKIALGMQDLFGNLSLMGQIAKYFGKDGWYDSRLEKMGVNPTITLEKQNELAGSAWQKALDSQAQSDAMQKALENANSQLGFTANPMSVDPAQRQAQQAQADAAAQGDYSHEGRNYAVPTGGFLSLGETPTADAGVIFSTGTGDFSSQYGPDQFGPGISAGETLNRQITQDRADEAAATASAAAAAQAATQGDTSNYGNEGNRGGGGESSGGGYSNANAGNYGWTRSGGGEGGGWAQGGHVSMQHLLGPNPKGPDDGYGALKDGEFVINNKAVKKYGIELMNAINSGKISKGKLRGLLEM